MRSKRSNLKSRNFAFLKKMLALILSLVVISGALGLALINSALDKINYAFVGEGEKNNQEGIGQAAVIDLKEYATELFAFDTQLEKVVVKGTFKPEAEHWQHDLIVLNLGDKEKTNNNVLMAIFSQNSVSHRQILQFVSPNIYVNFAGLANNPLGQSWLYGGAAALSSTLERNLGISITNTYLLDAGKLVDLIDSINGIALKIDESTLETLTKNQAMLENLLNGNNSVMHKQMNFAEYKETSIANGVLAVAYASLGSLTEKGHLVAAVLLRQISKEFNDLGTLERWHFIRRLLACLTTDASRFSIAKTLAKCFISAKPLICTQLPQIGEHNDLTLGNVVIKNIDITTLREQFSNNLQAEISQSSVEPDAESHTKVTTNS